MTRRSQAGLDVSDRIVLYVERDDNATAALALHREYLMGKTLAVASQMPHSAEAFVATHAQGDSRWTVHLARAIAA